MDSYRYVVEQCHIFSSNFFSSENTPKVQAWGAIKTFNYKPVNGKFVVEEILIRRTPLAAGVNPKTVQTMMGHANMQVTMGIYVRSTPQMNQAAASALNQFIYPTTPAVIPAPILPPQPVALKKTP